MLDFDTIDIESLAMALADQGDGDHRWGLNPSTGEVQLWTSDFGLDGDESVDAEDLERTDLVLIDPVPSHVWYRHMADFAAGVQDPRAQAALERALDGRKPFRRFKDALHGRFPELLSDWHSHQRECERRVVLGWLADAGLISEETPRTSRPIEKSPQHAVVATDARTRHRSSTTSPDPAP